MPTLFCCPLPPPAGTAEGPVVVWDFVTKGVAKTYSGGHSDAVTAVAWSRDGRHLASGSRDQSVILWDVLTGAEVRGRPPYPILYGGRGEWTPPIYPRDN